LGAEILANPARFCTCTFDTAHQQFEGLKLHKEDLEENGNGFNYIIKTSEDEMGGRYF
jgi:hypothetical protein